MASPCTAKGRARVVASRLSLEYPGSAAELCELDFTNSFQLLTATILSAQTTDGRVNMVTPTLFARYPTPEDLAQADPDELEGIIRSTGFFRSKARSLIGMANGLVDRFDSEVPSVLEDLITLPGVGRKTGNVVRSVALGLPGLPVDTHVGRLSRLLGLTGATDPEKVEADLCSMLPPSAWGSLSLQLILHGRRVSVARRPNCQVCILADVCPSAQIPLRRPPPTKASATKAKAAKPTVRRAKVGSGAATAGAGAAISPSPLPSPKRVRRLSAGGE